MISQRFTHNYTYKITQIINSIIATSVDSAAAKRVSEMPIQRLYYLQIFYKSISPLKTWKASEKRQKHQNLLTKSMNRYLHFTHFTIHKLHESILHLYTDLERMGKLANDFQFIFISMMHLYLCSTTPRFHPSSRLNTPLTSTYQSPPQTIHFLLLPTNYYLDFSKLMIFYLIDCIRIIKYNIKRITCT